MVVSKQHEQQKLYHNRPSVPRKTMYGLGNIINRLLLPARVIPAMCQDHEQIGQISSILATTTLSRTSPNHCAMTKRARDPAITAESLLKALYIRNIYSLDGCLLDVVYY